MIGWRQVAAQLAARLSGSAAEPATGPPGAAADARAAAPSTGNDRDTVAAAAAELALSFPPWVRRRKWTFSYVDDTTVRRQQSIDFQLPPPERFALPPTPGATLYVPLWIPAKVPLVNLDMRDEAGRSLSVLTRGENGPIAADGLALILADPVSPDGLDERELRAALNTLVTLNPNDTADAGKLADAAANPRIVSLLDAEDDRSGLVRELTNGFMFLVPVVYDPGRDRVLKVSVDTPHLWYGETDTWRARALGVLVALGLADKTQEFPEVEAGLSRSLHLQVTAPDDVELAAASIEARQFDPDRQCQLPWRRVRTVYDQPTADLSVALRVQVPPVTQLPDADNPTPDAIAAIEETRRDIASCRGDLARLVVRLRPPVRGVFVAAWLVSMLTTVVIWLVRSRLVELDGQISATLLLTLPASLAAYLARPGEHAFAARLLLGVRILALVVGLCGLTVAAIIAAGEIRQTPAASGAQTLPARIVCTEAADGSRPPAQSNLQAPRRLVAPQAPTSLDCQVRPSATAAVPAAEATAGARTAVLVAGLLAGFATLILTAGILRTTSADLRDRSRDDFQADPPGPNV